MDRIAGPGRRGTPAVPRRNRPGGAQRTAYRNRRVRAAERARRAARACRLAEHQGWLPHRDARAAVHDRDARGGVPVSYGSLRSDDLHTLGRLIVAAPDLGSYLGQFLQPGIRLAVSTPDGRVLARADALAQTVSLGSEAPILARLYRRFVDRPQDRQLIEAEAPIYDRDHAAVIGKLQVTQTPDRWIRLPAHALTRMLNFTLGTSIVAVIAMFAFAAWLALRLARLRRASEAGLTRAGPVTRFPG